MRDAEIVIVGAGVAGSALAAVLARRGVPVLLLEKTERHVDRVRGEFIVLWGVAELRALGLYEALMRAGGHHTRRHVPYGEGVDPELARSRAVDLGGLLPDVPGSLCIRHPAMCDALNAAAVEAGAVLLRGVDRVAVRPGLPPELAFSVAGATRTLRPRLVVGADGRASTVARQIGGRRQRGPPHHFLAGLLVEGVESWPAEEQTIGVEGDVCYYVFPQGEGRARLYLGYARSEARRLAGASAASSFLAALRLRSLPGAERLAAAAPIGPCRSYPNEEAWLERPAADGVVLVGDAAGYDDPTMGQGLANAFHDARLVSGIILGERTSAAASFAPYAAVRAERTRRQAIHARVIARVRMEFDEAARRRRRRAAELAAADPEVGALMSSSMRGALSLRPEIFEERVWAPLLT
jgi:menaquinone-9 beta-reductase